MRIVQLLIVYQVKATAAVLYGFYVSMVGQGLRKIRWLPTHGMNMQFH
jgi:hypothetical protein